MVVCGNAISSVIFTKKVTSGLMQSYKSELQIGVTRLVIIHF